MKKDTFVRMPHRKRNIISYVALYLVLLYVTPYINQLYNRSDHLVIKLLIIGTLIGIALYASNEVYVRYYEHHNVREVCLKSIPIEGIFGKGRKQFVIESIVVLILLSISLFLIVLFLLFRQFIFIFFAIVLSSPYFVFLRMRPFKRLKLLRKGERLMEERFSK